MRRARETVPGFWHALWVRTTSSASSIVASVIVMNVQCVDGIITMECQPEENQGDSPIRTGA